MATTADIHELIQSFLKSQALIAAVKLKVFETLKELDYPLTASIIAGTTGVSTPYLERLLNMCTCLGLLTKTTEGGRQLYQLTPCSRTYLTEGGEFDFLGAVNFLSSYKWCPTEISDAIHKGKDGVNNFTDVMHNGPAYDHFVRYMDGIARLGGHYFSDIDLSSFKVIMDLGGCSGTHARAIKKLYPKSRVILADIQMVIDSAKAFEKNKGIDLEYKAVDFFDVSSMPSADLVILSHILHDWKDDKSIAILSNVYQVLNPGGKVMLMEKVLDEEKSGPFSALSSDLRMLVHTGGQERSFSEYSNLLKAAGFTDITLTADQSNPSYDVIFGCKQ